jgi:uncharacterized repeat protein (TIGR02543 family)
MKKRILLYICVALLGCVATSHASKLVKVKVIDKDYLLVYFEDGIVTFNETVSSSALYTNDNPGPSKNKVVRYGPALNTAEAVNASNWTISSADDPAFGTSGVNPMSCSRKSKINGMAELDWVGSDFKYEVTMEHSIYLKLPQSMSQGKTYTLSINALTNTDITSMDITFDIFNSPTEAIHVNLIGYLADASVKDADLYLWMGDGGARDYSSFQGNKVYLYDVNAKTSQEVGAVAFWKANTADAGNYKLINSNVWKVDFTGFATPGTYRLAVEGVGCSEDFTIGNNAYFEPFKLSTLGFFYMRLGQDNLNMTPVPRRPLYIPGISPVSTKVILTTMQPWHASWKTFTGGDAWDNPAAWAKYAKTGSPSNPNAYGGHADAMDWDRHLGHISIIYDMLLPYILNQGVISDDNLGIAESGNGIPDILDEARNEVDFWLRLRDGKAYSHGVTNPGSNNVMYQAGTNAMAAWASAANAAMLSDCFRIAGLTDLMNTYRDSAMAAYNFAGTLPDQQLDVTHNVGDVIVRGRDLKMTAAAFLYNVTGDINFEKVINAESLAKTNTSAILNSKSNQLWATAGYLMTKQKVNYPSLFNFMQASIINEAKTQEANNTLSRPSRRAADNSTCYWKTSQNVQRTMIAHAVTINADEKAFFKNALVLEADWGLGRNPLNMIQMTTASTSLENKRSYENIYATGRNDGTPGLHPGLTPYQNTDDWYAGMVMGKPSWMTAQCYPDYATAWPKAEGYFNSRYVYAHSEFTPQQTMRGKMALYGYLYGLYRPHTQKYTLTGNISKGALLVSPQKEYYSFGDTVTLTAIPETGRTFKGWTGDASGTVNPVTIVMTSNKTVTANLDIPQGSKELMDAVPEVYPNPATTFLSVRMPENAGNGKICITDAGGRVMMRKSVNFGINQVDISGLTEGFYTISIVSENYNKVCGFMVMRQ